MESPEFNYRINLPIFNLFPHPRPLLYLLSQTLIPPMLRLSRKISLQFCGLESVGGGLCGRGGQKSSPSVWGPCFSSDVQPTPLPSPSLLMPFSDVPGTLNPFAALHLPSTSYNPVSHPSVLFPVWFARLAGLVPLAFCCGDTWKVLQGEGARMCLRPAILNRKLHVDLPPVILGGFFFFSPPSHQGR